MPHRPAGHDLLTGRGGVLLRASWRDALLLNLHSRLAQRVLVQLSHTPYRSEQDLYAAASAVAWEIWFTPRQSFKVEVTAQHSPLKSLNFAALKRQGRRGRPLPPQNRRAPRRATPSGPMCASTCT
jgi:23S rRNA G2445 N2-methylase RlmL